jgi:hypothetical protein
MLAITPAEVFFPLQDSPLSSILRYMLKFFSCAYLLNNTQALSHDFHALSGHSLEPLSESVPEALGGSITQGLSFLEVLSTCLSAGWTRLS